MAAVKYLVITHIGPHRPSRSVPGNHYREVELVDPFGEPGNKYYTFVDDEFLSFHKWAKPFEVDLNTHRPVLEGTFKVIPGKRIDAKCIKASSTFKMSGIFNVDDFEEVMTERGII